MSSRRTTFEKTQRARAKKAKADIKRAKRQGTLEDVEIPEGSSADFALNTGGEEVEESRDTSDWLPSGQLSPGELMNLVERCHADYDSGRIDFDEFETRKLELMERLSVD